MPPRRGEDTPPYIRVKTHFKTVYYTICIFIRRFPYAIQH